MRQYRERKTVATPLRTRVHHHENMSGNQWPQTFSGFSGLQVELPCYIVQQAIKDAMAERCMRFLWLHDHRACRELKSCDHRNREGVGRGGY